MRQIPSLDGPLKATLRLSGLVGASRVVREGPSKNRISIGPLRTGSRLRSTCVYLKSSRIGGGLRALVVGGLQINA
jgi:hypothetical protein